ncbi:hypothetical protein OROHE_013625 [Orobanche hederae]
MEKNKNRTDMLAAGRKKLQQFRQKKDGSSKSSSKASKSGHDATAASDVTTANDETFARAGIPEILPPAGASEIPLESSGVDKSRLNQSADDGRVVDSGVPQKDESSSLVLDTKNNVPGASDSIIPVENLEDSSTSLPIEFLPDLVRHHGKEQETDVGAMQEVGSSCESQIDGVVLTQPQEDGNIYSNNLGEMPGENKTAESGNTGGAAQLSKTDDVSLTGLAANDVEESMEGHDHAIVISPLTDHGPMLTVSSVVPDHHREYILSGSLNDEKTEMLDVSEGPAGFYTDGTPARSDATDVEILSMLKTDETAKSLGRKQVDLSSILDGSVVKLSQLAGILRILDEDEFRFLIMSRELSVEKFRVGHDAFERLKEQLYVTTFSRDAFHLQLSEQQMLFNEIFAVNASLTEVQVKNEAFAQEIAQCRYELQEVVSEREDLQNQLDSSKVEIEGFSAKVDELQKKLEMAQDEMASLSSELVGCRNFVQSLQAENENLNKSLKVMTEEGNKLSEENVVNLLENEKMTGELAQSKASLESLQTLLKDDRRQLEEKIESMVYENSKLHADLANFMSTVEALELENRNLNEILTSASKERNKHKEDKEFMVHQIEKMSKESMDCKDLVVALQLEISNLNGYLTSTEEDKIKLEQEKESIFNEYEKQFVELVETKVLEAVLQADCRNAVDDLNEATFRIKQLTEENETMNADLELHKLKLKDFDRKDYTSQLQEVASVKDRSEYESLREYTGQVERANIELTVLYQVMSERISRAATKECGLMSSCDALKKQEMDLKSENSQLREKLNDFHGKISELESQLDGICRDSNEMVASISKQVQTLQAQVADRESFLEEEWNSVCAQVLQAVGVLDSTIKTFSTNSLAGGDNNLGIVGLIAASVDGVTKVIEGMHGQLEAASREHREISNRNDMALHTLHTLYSELSQLVSKMTIDNAVVDDKVLDLLHHDVFNTLLDQLKQFSGKILRLESENKLLGSELMCRASEADELEKKCLKSDTIMKLVEEIEQSVRMDSIEIIDADERASRLESLIHLLIQKYKEADQHVILSTSLEVQLSELQGQVEHLNIVLVQYGNENFVFKESLKNAEEDVVALNSKVQEKVAELEMSEQRVLSLREKLSIAVTKGKGLIAQRDNLKQSLAETSKELEKSSQELLSKDARLHELESTLKVYSGLLH